MQEQEQLVVGSNPTPRSLKGLGYAYRGKATTSSLQRGTGPPKTAVVGGNIWR